MEFPAPPGALLQPGQDGHRSRGCSLTSFPATIKLKRDINSGCYQSQKRNLYLESNDQNYALSQALIDQDRWQRKAENGFLFPRVGFPDISPILFFNVTNYNHYHHQRRFLMRIMIDPTGVTSHKSRDNSKNGRIIKKWCVVYLLPFRQIIYLIISLYNLILIMVRFNNRRSRFLIIWQLKVSRGTLDTTIRGNHCPPTSTPFPLPSHPIPLKVCSGFHTLP